MSKYLSFSDVSFKDRATLVAALGEIGCRSIKEGNDLEMGRYWGEQSKNLADVIIPRNTIGNSFGDIGFTRTDDGSYTPVIDDLDQARVLDGKFIQRLRAAYNERVVHEVAARLKGSLRREMCGNVLKIRVRY